MTSAAEPSVRPTPPGDGPVIAVDDVRVGLGGVPVLRGITATVENGEAVALLGGNGSGKSTLVRAALGLVAIQHGDIAVFGTPVRRFSDWRRIGYVPQRSTLAHRGATVEEVVGSGRLSMRRPFAPARRADREAVTQALEQVGLVDRRRHQVVTLSGGQQQRVLIARALVCDPDLLIMDEPMAGVDLHHQDLLGALIGELITGGRSMLVVLHELGPLGDVVDRAITLQGGRVVADGALPSHHHDHHPLPAQHRELTGEDLMAPKARR